MASVTYYVALPFSRNDEGDLVPGEAQECQTSLAAIRRAQSLSARAAGAVAFSRTGDPAIGEFEPADVIRRFGEVPPDVCLGCDKCFRRGEYRLANLAKRYGSRIRLGELLQFLVGECRLWSAKSAGLIRSAARISSICAARGRRTCRPRCKVYA